MNKILLTLFLFSFLIKSFSQKNEKIIEFSFDTIGYKYPEFNIDKTTIDGTILRAIVTKSKTKKTIAEFLRITDNIYYFLQRNDSNSIILEGKAFLQKVPFQKMKINKYNKNGEVNGYSFFNFHQFTKEGIWYETLTDSTARYGKYSNNKKDSIWNYTKTITHSVGILEKAVTYKNDETISETNLNILSKSKKEIEKELIAEWTVDNLYNPNDSIIAIRKVENNIKGKILITFYKNGECNFFGRGHHKSTSQIYQWKHKNNSIDITLESKTKFIIENMNKGYLVIKIIYN
jgi:hypothetical protein